MCKDLLQKRQLEVILGGIEEGANNPATKWITPCLAPPTGAWPAAFNCSKSPPTRLYLMGLSLFNSTGGRFAQLAVEKVTLQVSHQEAVMPSFEAAINA